MAKKKYTLRKDGRYQTKISVNGKTKYIYGKTQSEIDEQLLDIKILLRQGVDLVSAQHTFEQWSNSWLKIKKMEISDSSYNSLKYPLEHLLFHFGRSPISDVKHIDIQDLIHNLAMENPSTGNATSINTMKKVLNTANQIFDLAIQNQAITFNPSVGVTVPKFNPPKKRRALTSQEQGWVTCTEHRAQLPAMIMMYAGLRRGEMLALTWNDVDLLNRKLSINKAIVFEGNRPVLKNQTKTEAGMRTIDIPAVLVDYLSKQPKSSLYVTTTAGGNVHSQSSWKRLWESYLCTLNAQHGDFSFYEKAGKNKFDPKGLPVVIPNLTPHYLRHTFVTNLVLAGVDISTAKKQVGHEDIKTLLDIYTHINEHHQSKEMSKLDLFFDNQHA